MEPETMPKPSKINANTSIENETKNGKSCFAERLKQAKVFAGQQKQGFRPVSVQTGKVLKNIEIMLKSIPKSNKKQCKIRARKSDAKMMRIMF